MDNGRPLVIDRGTDQIAVHLHENPDAETLVVIAPAMGVPGSYYDRLAVCLVDAGFEVAVADLRGTGESRPRPGRASRYGYSDLADDIGAVLENLKPQRDKRRTILLGHSLGGQAALIHLTRGADDVDGLVLIAVGLPYWRTYGLRGLGVYAFTQGIAVAARVMRVWPGWGFGGRQSRGVIQDWAFTARHGRFPRHLDAEAGLAGLTVAVLAISVDADQYTPAPTMDHLVRKLTSAAVRREHLSAEAAGMPLDHFKWVRAGDTLAPRIKEWLAESSADS